MVKDYMNMFKDSKILLIEEDENDNLLIQVVLESKGYNVCSENVRSRVISKIVRVQPDLILVDFIISGRYQYSYLKDLVNNDNVKNIPIITISDKGNPVDEKLLVKVGIVDNINKPVHDLVLYDKINTALRLRSPDSDNW